jgi:hypothetical protein
MEAKHAHVKKHVEDFKWSLAQHKSATSTKITSLTDTISSLQTKPPTSSPQHPSTQTNVPNHSTTPHPHPFPPPTSLALPWRCEFLLVGSAAPGFYINFVIKGNSWHDTMGGSFLTTCGGAMGL